MNLLDYRRIALIGRCLALVKKKKMIGACLLNLRILIGTYMPIEFKDFDWYMRIEICPARI